MGSAFDLAGRVALLTGGASGIGSGIAEVLAEAGALVIIADIDLAGAEAQAGKLREAGHRAAAIRIDLSDEASIVAGCAEVAAAHGVPWVLVNNAGMQIREPLLDGTVAHWERTSAINARGPYLMIREVARAMVAKGGGGRIVNIASASLVGAQVKGGSAYVASKGALLGLGIATALELVEHGITVNTVLPGGVVTPGAVGAGPPAEGPGCRRPPLGMSEPRDIGAAVLFFATPAARKVTNQVIAVDAGWSLS